MNNRWYVERSKPRRDAFAVGQLARTESEAIFDCLLSATVRVFIGLLQRLCRAELRIEQPRRISQAAGIASGS